MITVGTELIVTTMMTRSSGDCAPAIRKIVLSGDFGLNVNFSSKPLALSFPALAVTRTLCSASITTFGTGKTTTGPTSSVMWMPLSTAASGNARSQRDANAATDFFHERLHAQHAVRICDLPRRQ